MKILFLGYENSSLIKHIQKTDEVISTSKYINLSEIKEYKPDFIISYGYKYIIKDEVLRFYPNRVINLHISLLPWNRGYYPNFWSFYENTPKGVTIHLIDEGIDTGAILFQKEIMFTNKEDTLERTYNRLRREIEKLFIKNWKSIHKGDINPYPQTSIFGSHHYRRDLEHHWEKLVDGWKTKTQLVEQLGAFDRKQ